MKSSIFGLLYSLPDISYIGLALWSYYNLFNLLQLNPTRLDAGDARLNATPTQGPQPQAAAPFLADAVIPSYIFPKPVLLKEPVYHVTNTNDNFQKCIDCGTDRCHWMSV